MTPSRAPLVVALALLSACSDSASGPPPLAEVSIHLAEIPLDERTLSPNATLQLGARLLTAGGKPAEGPAVTWRSSAPNVATVDGTGLVTARAVGKALIIASSGPISDTARINVAEAVSGAVDCGSAEPLRLAVGGIHTTTADQAVTLCVEGGPGAEFALIPLNGSRVNDARAALAVRIEASGTVPTTTALSELAPLRTFGEVPVRDGEFHRELRRGAMAELEPRRRALHAATPRAGVLRSTAAADPPKVGDLLRINVQSAANRSCSDPIYRSARVAAVTHRAIVLADTGNPAGGFTDEEYRAFGEGFDRVVYPLDTETFGTPSDLDENQRVMLFFTRAVNDLTSRGSGFYIAGYFYDRDLFPKTGDAACAGSNQGELFYMMVPDAARAADGELVFSKTHVREHTLGVVAHELQHLINASRRLHVVKSPLWEEEWLNEAMSHVAEELLFYREAGLAPRGNHSGATISSPAARHAFAAYGLQNVDRLVRFLANPSGASPIATDDQLATRGASWTFLRYAADRRGGNEQEMWRALVDSKTAGLTNLAAVIGADPIDWLHDWAVALYVDDTRIAPPERFSQPSWNFRAILPSLISLGGSQSYSRYPLQLRGLWNSEAFDAPLRAGSTAYLRFGVPEGTRAAIRTTSGGLPAPSTLRLAVVRTK